MNDRSKKHRHTFAYVILAMALTANAATPGKSEVRFGKQTKETIGLVTEMSAGDVACYVSFRSDNGVEHHEMAGFSICDLKIQGRRVRFRYEQVRILAPVCMGNPDCKHTVLEPLIVSATVIDPAHPPVTHITPKSATRPPLE